MKHGHTLFAFFRVGFVRRVCGLSLRLFLIPALCLCLHQTNPALAATSFGPKASFEVGFSPRGESLDIILNAIKGAKKSILVAAYSYTSKPISEALGDAHRRGVNVQVVADKKGNSSKHTAVNFLASQGVPVRINGRYAIFHHKFMVIDGCHLKTGSFNYSAAAVNRNAENVLFLRDVPDLAGMYAREWEKYWKESEEVTARIETTTKRRNNMPLTASGRQFGIKRDGE